MAVGGLLTTAHSETELGSVRSEPRVRTMAGGGLPNDIEIKEKQSRAESDGQNETEDETEDEIGWSEIQVLRH